MDAFQQQALRPFIGFEGRAKPAWIDVNRHVNVAWYDHVFDIAETALIAAYGIDDDYIRANGRTIFRLEKRIRYERELLDGDNLRVESRIVSNDERLLTHLHELLNLTKGVRAATAEYVSIHFDLAKRKSARITDPLVLEPLRELAASHALLPPVEGR
jgi:acyl-CoA thioester hydrolase